MLLHKKLFASSSQKQFLPSMAVCSKNDTPPKQGGHGLGNALLQRQQLYCVSAFPKKCLPNLPPDRPVWFLQGVFFKNNVFVEQNQTISSVAAEFFLWREGGGVDRPWGGGVFLLLGFPPSLKSTV